MFVKSVILLFVLGSLKDGQCASFIGKKDPLVTEGLFEGDIAGIDPHNRNMMTYIRKLWKDNTVYYVLSHYLEPHRKVIEDQMREYERITDNCLKFKEGKGDGNYINIIQSYGCSSYIGMEGGMQNMSLGTNCYDPGVILHEIGHALGFYHEQSRSDRDDYISINYQNIQTGEEDQFRNLDPNMNYLITRYDYGSIMHYADTTFSKNGKKTFWAKDPNINEIKGPYDMTTISESDLIELKTLYSCPGFKHPKQKKLRNIYCSFRDECIFKSSSESFFGNFGISSHGGRYFRIASRRRLAEFQLVSDIIPILSKTKACIQFDYNIEVVNDLEINSMLLETVDHHKRITIDLPRNNTKGWKTYKKEYTFSEDIIITYNVRTSLEEYATVLFTDFRFDYEPCS